MNDPGHPSPHPTTGKQLRETLLGVGRECQLAICWGGGMTAGERSPPQAEQGQQRKREEEKKVPMAGAEHRGSEREGALRA